MPSIAKIAAFVRYRVLESVLLKFMFERVIANDIWKISKGVSLQKRYNVSFLSLLIRLRCRNTSKTIFSFAKEFLFFFKSNLVRFRIRKVLITQIAFGYFMK